MGNFCGIERAKLYECPFVNNWKTINNMSILQSPEKIFADTH